MMAALIAGQRDPKVLSQMARSRLRTQDHTAGRGVRGAVHRPPRFPLAKMLARVDAITADIADLDAGSRQHIAPFRRGGTAAG